jgi:hypothetical protein
MHIVGVPIMVLAVAGYIGCRMAGVSALYVLRGASLQVTFSRPAGALDSNYAVLRVRLLWLWLAAFLVGLVILLVAGALNAA